MIAWIINVFISVFLITVITLLLPEGRLSKFVKPFISFILILIILTPVVNVRDFIDDLSSDKISFTLDENFLFDTVRAKIAKIEQNCIKIAEKNGINGAIVTIEYTVDENYEPKINGAKIYLQNTVINADEEHIVIMQGLVENVAEYLSVSTAGVKVYE